MSYARCAHTCIVHVLPVQTAKYLLFLDALLYFEVLWAVLVTKTGSEINIYDGSDNSFFMNISVCSERGKDLSTVLSSVQLWYIECECMLVH